MNESIVVHGSSATSIVERIHILLGDLSTYSVSQPFPEVVQIVGNKRGLFRGSPPLCTVRVVAEPQRLIVTIIGQLELGDLDALRAAVLGRSGDQMRDAPVESFRPSYPTSSAGFVPPTDWFVADTGATPSETATSPVEPRHSLPTLISRPDERAEQTIVRSWPAPVTAGAACPLVVRIGHGEPRPVPVFALIGRAPQPRADDPTTAELIIVSDEAMSKTHLAMGLAGTDVWVTDRNSSNGTQLLAPSGLQELEPEARVVLSPGTRLVAGDTTLTIESAT